MNTALVFISIASLTLALAMSVMAWRLVRADRRRSDARVQALDAAIYDDVAPPPAPTDWPASQSASTRARTIAAATVAAVVVMAAVLLFTGRGDTAGPASPPAAAVAAATSVEKPLELIALDHEQASQGLVVRGVVRNPPVGVEVDRLTAVVLAFGDDGGFITSARAEVERVRLEPGTETAFSVTVPNASGVGRFRVSFRIDQRVLPHVDRRS